MRKGTSIKLAAGARLEELANNLLFGVLLNNNSILVVFKGTGIALIKMQT